MYDSVTPGVPGLAGQAGANGQAAIAINANHLQLGAGSYLDLGISASVGSVPQALNTPGGALFQCNGNVFQAGGDSILSLQGVYGGSAVIDIGAGTLTIAGSPINRIAGFDTLLGTGYGGDRFIDAPGSQNYGSGGDTVVFRPGHGADTVSVAPFQPRHPLPAFGTIELDGFGPTFGQFSQVLAASVDTGANTRIATPDGGSILITGYHVADLTAADFHFG